MSQYDINISVFQVEYTFFFIGIVKLQLYIGSNVTEKLQCSISIYSNGDTQLETEYSALSSPDSNHVSAYTLITKNQETNQLPFSSTKPMYA